VVDSSCGDFVTEPVDEEIVCSLDHRSTINKMPLQMGSHFAPKVEKLRKKESPADFESWRENLLFSLAFDGNFEEFLEDNYKWEATTVNNRGMKADETVPPGKTAKQKAALLHLLLGSIASYAPIISREFIVHDALCLDDIWNRLRTYVLWLQKDGIPNPRPP
jgi:hypothetical protein